MKFFLILLAVTSLISCSLINGPTKGGADDVPNFIRGVVLDYNNTPVANAQVTLRNISFENSQQITNQEITTHSSNTGEFVFQNEIIHQRYALTASFENKSKALGRIEITEDSLALDPFTIENTATVSGRVLNSTGVTVLIAGVSQGVQTDVNGVYVIENVPIGEYDLTFITNSAINFLPIVISPSADTVFVRDIEITTDSLSSYSFFATTSTPAFFVTPVVYEIGSEPDWYVGRNFDKVRYFLPSPTGEYREIDASNSFVLLLDNFEHSPFKAAGVRFFFDDLAYGGSSRVLQDITHNDLSNAIIESETGSNFLEVDFVLDSALSYAHAGIGFGFNTERVYVDLSELTAVSFMIRGNLMPVRFEFVSRAGEQFAATDENWGHFGREIIPGPEWQRVEIPVTEFVPLPDSRFATEGFVWSDVNTQITAFNILAERMPGDTISLSIDYIYLHGITLESIF